MVKSKSTNKKNCNLICMIGLPYSGKTTTALTFAFPIVNRDAIRFSLYGKRYDGTREDEVTEIENRMVECLFFAGHEWIIIDACHLKKKYLERWKDLGYRVTGRPVLTKLEECIKRAKDNCDIDTQIIIEDMAKESDMVDYRDKGFPTIVGKI